MTSLRLSPDDPKLTAFALGELPASEHDAIEEALARQPELRSVVAEIQSMAVSLEAALADEAAADIVLPPPVGRGPSQKVSLSNRLTPPSASDVGRGLRTPPSDVSPVPPRGSLPDYEPASKLLRFPRLYFMAGGLAAACIALLLVLRPATPKTLPAEAGATVAAGSPGTPLPGSAAPSSSTDVPVLAGGQTPESVPPLAPASAGTSDSRADGSATAFRTPERMARAEVATPDTSPAAAPFTERASEPSVTPGVAPSTAIAAPAIKTFPSVVSREADRPGSIAAMPGNSTHPVVESVQDDSVAEPMEAAPSDGALGSVPWGGGFVSAARVRRSTFTAPEGVESHRAVAAALEAGKLPARADVRGEELINHFLGASESRHSVGAGPIVAAVECAAAPWNPAHRLLRIGIVGRAAPDASPALADMIIADAVTLQVEFNPARVASYRLIGYEAPTMLARLKAPNVPSVSFKAGQTLAAIYELVPARAESSKDQGYAPVQHLGYAPENPDAPDLLTLRVRFHDVLAQRSRRIDMPLVDRGTAFAAASGDFAFAAAVAQFTMMMRDTPHRGSVSVADLRQWVGRAAASPKRAEFEQWLERAAPLLK